MIGVLDYPRHQRLRQAHEFTADGDDLCLLCSITSSSNSKYSRTKDICGERSGDNKASRSFSPI